MDEDIAALMRRLVAQQMAQQFILDFLLNSVFMPLSRQTRLDVAGALLDASAQTEFVSGLAKGDDLVAANVADIVVQMQDIVDQAVGRALLKTAEVEDARFARPIE